MSKKIPTVDELSELYSGKLPKGCELEIVDELNNKAIFAKDNHYYLQTDLKQDECHEIVPVAREFDDVTVYNYTRDGIHLQRVEAREEYASIFDNPIELKNQEIEEGMSNSSMVKEENGSESVLTVMLKNDTTLSILYQNKQLDIDFSTDNVEKDALLTLMEVSNSNDAKEAFAILDMRIMYNNQGGYPQSFESLANLVMNAEGEKVKDVVSIEDIAIEDTPYEMDFTEKEANVQVVLSDSALEYLMHDNQILDISQSLYSLSGTDAHFNTYAMISEKGNDDFSVHLQIAMNDMDVNVSLDEDLQKELIQKIDEVLSWDNSSISQRFEEEREEAVEEADVYPYLEMVTEDVKDFIENNVELSEYAGKRVELSEHLQDILYSDSNITGGNDGSYTHDAEEAKQNLKGNENLVDIVKEKYDITLESPEEIDVAIRQELLPEAITKAIHEMEMEQNIDLDEQDFGNDDMEAGDGD